MKRLSYNITTRDGMVSVKGWSFGTPGMAVHKRLSGKPGWYLDHLASGRTIVPRAFPLREQAIAFGESIGSVADWTLSRDDLNEYGSLSPEPWNLGEFIRDAYLAFKRSGVAA